MSSDPHQRNASHNFPALLEELARRLYGPGTACSPLPEFEGGYAVWMEQNIFDYERAVFAVTFTPFEHPEADYFRLMGDVDITDAWDDVEATEGNGGTTEPPPVGAFSIPEDLYVSWFDGLWHNMFALMAPSACAAVAALYGMTPEEFRQQALDAQRDGIVDGASFTSTPTAPPGGMPPSAWSKTGKRTTPEDLLGFV